MSSWDDAAATWNDATVTWNYNSGTIALVPTSTVSSTGWITTGAADPHLAVDETSSSDIDFVTSPDSPTNSVLELQFNGVTDPQANTDHIVSYRINAVGGSHSVRVSLMEGTVERAFWLHTDLTDSFQTFMQILTITEADSITNYNDLRIRVTATAS